MTVEATAASRARDVVAANLRGELAKRRFTQQAFGDLLGWSARQVQRRVLAEDEFGIGDIVSMARALGVAPSVLLAGLDDMTTTEG